MKNQWVVCGVVGIMVLGLLSVSWADDVRPGLNAPDSTILLAQTSPPKLTPKIVPKPVVPSKPGTTPAIPAGAQPAGMVTPTLSIIKPDAGTKWCLGTQQTIQWAGNLPATANLKIELLNSTGSVFKVVTASTPNTGNYLWDLQLSQYVFGEGLFKLRISALDGSAKAENAANFKLGLPLYISAPKSNYTWRKGSSYQIAWFNGCSISSTALKIDLLNSAKQFALNIAPSAPLNQPYQWTVPTTLTTGTYYIRLTTADNLYTAESSFKIDDPVAAPVSNPQMTIVKPDASSKWCIGETYNIQWSSILPAATNLKIELLQSDNSPWKVITAGTPNTGSYAFNILSRDYNFGSGTFRLKISNPDGTVFSTTPNFQIGRQLYINAPKSNYTWRKGSTYTISWTNGCTIAATTVKVELLDSSKALVQTMISNHPLNQIYSWTVPANLAAGVYYIRVTTTDGLFSAEGSFNIGEPV